VRTRFDRTEAGDIPYTASELVCPASRYSVAANRGFVQRLGTCQGRVVAGENVGLEFELSGIVVRGQVSRDGQTILYDDLGESLQRLTSPLGDSEAICGLAGNAVKIR
jgi:hypothetical protein